MSRPFKSTPYLFFSVFPKSLSCLLSTVTVFPLDQYHILSNTSLFSDFYTPGTVLDNVKFVGETLKYRDRF